MPSRHRRFARARGARIARRRAAGPSSRIAARPIVVDVLTLSGTGDAGTQINGALATAVTGVSAYAFVDDSIYAEVGTYRSLSPAMQIKFGEGAGNDIGKLDDSIDPLIESDYQTVTPVTKIKLLKNVFNDAKVICVNDGDEMIGVITKIDLIDYLATRRAA